jgi:vancomycin resistance protein YoaR
MAAIDEVLTVPGDAPSSAVAPRRRSKLRLFVGFVFGFAIGLAAVAGIAAGALITWDRSYEARILPGVTAAGISLAGMDRAQATAALEKAYDPVATGRVVVETDAGDVSVPYARFGRHVDTDAMVQEALETGRDGTTAERALGEVRLALTGHDIQPTLELDAAALAANVKDALSSLDRAPVDAAIVQGPKGPYTIGAQVGAAYDGTAATAAAVEAVSRLDAPAEVRVQAQSTVIPPAHDDAEIAAAKTSAQQMGGGRVVVTFRDQKWKIPASTVKSWLGFGTAADGSVQPVADVAKIQKALKKVAKGVRRAPLNAAYLRAPGGHIVGVAAGKDGLRLDAPATAAAIRDALLHRASGAAALAVAVKIARIPPKVTTEEAVKKGPLMQMLGMWKTWFPVSDHNFFGANIWRPAQIIDGTVLYPGQRFEWWSAIGPVTSSRGFGPGGFIAGDHTEPTGALGGGMCSSSTTLFNAAMRAGLQMGARSNHKYYIYRYPLGLDATVSKMGGSVGQTMSFTNDMKHPIVIRSYRYTAGGVGWVRYEIWGIPDGRTVSLSKPSVSNVLQSHTSTEYVSTLPRGVREQTEYPADGMDVSVSRVVRNHAGKIIHTDTWRSHYVLWNGIIQVGR